jgi:hypothetical protein
MSESGRDTAVSGSILNAKNDDLFEVADPFRQDDTRQQQRSNSRTLLEDDDEEILEMRDQVPHDQNSSNNNSEDTARSSPLASCMFGEVSVFRDFFLAAFSDGYNSVS